MSEAALLLVALLAVAGPEEPPLTLRQAIERAAASAPEVGAAAAAQAESEADARLSRAPFRPELSLNTGPGWGGGVPAPILGRLPSIAGVELRQSVYDADRLARAEEAKGRLAEAQGGLRAARLRAAEEAVGAFARCRAGESMIGAAEARAQARRAALERAEGLYGEGRVTELEVRRSRLGLLQAEQELRRARSERDLQELALRRLLLWPPERPLRLAPEPPELGSPSELDGDLAAARVTDPLLRSLADRITAEERALRIRGRLVSPVVDVAAQYSRLYKTGDWDEFYQTFKPDNWSVGASINVPLFSGGRLGAEEARSRASLDRLRAEQASRERGVEIEVRRAQDSLAQAREGTEVARLSVDVAAEDLRVARALLAEGRSEPAGVAEKEQSLAESRRDLALAEADLVAALARRLALRGELVPE